MVPMYLAEVAPHNLRGGIVLVDRLFYSIGILVAQLVGLQNALPDEGKCRTCLGQMGHTTAEL